MKDTVPDYGIPVIESPIIDEGIRNQNQNSNGGNIPSAGTETTNDFLSKVIRRELGLIIREMMIPKPNPPKTKEQSGQDYLWALLRNLPSNA